MPFIFSAGTARGGTNFRTLLLDGHPQIGMSIDPFIPLFRLYRDCLLDSVGKADLLTHVPRAVLDDYYFSRAKFEVLAVVQQADPDIPFPLEEWPSLREALASRMRLASVNLIPHLHLLPAPTFREVFENTMAVVASVKGDDLVWVGFNDNWAAEFFRPLAKLIPDARFLLHLRDPRAVVHSAEFAEPDIRKRPTVLSLARHLRKHLALAEVFRTDPLLDGRLLVTRYEPFFEDLEGEIRRMTDFLDVPYVPDMADVSAFRKADGTPWESDWRIYQETVDIWRREMPLPMVELTEFICDPEMRLHGYSPMIFQSDAGLSPAAMRFALENSRECLGWRTDFPDIEHTLGCELFRRQLLSSDEANVSPDIVQRCFLFAQVYQRAFALGQPDSTRRSLQESAVP